MDSERFQALLSHQGALVHVDHSHRAPAPTGEWWAWRLEVDVTAGQVREAVSKLKNKRFLTRGIRADGRVFHVQFSIDTRIEGGNKVHVYVWERDRKDKYTAEAFYPRDDHVRLLAPEPSLKPVLKKAFAMLLEAPELVELANSWSFKKFYDVLSRKKVPKRIELGDNASVAWQRVDSELIGHRNQINVVKGDKHWSCGVKDDDFNTNIVQVAKLTDEGVQDMGKLIRDFQAATIEKTNLTRIWNGLRQAFSGPVEPVTQGSGMTHYPKRG